MWNHPATQANLKTLRDRGHLTIDPDDGALACGMVGPGRLAEPAAIADAVANLNTATKRDLDGEVVLITAGPTQEPLDAVRYLSNRSSGKMGYAIAEDAAARGARVILVSGPVALPEPAGVEVIHAQTARQMFDAVMKHLDESTIIVKAAAVADYYRASAPHHKVKKTAARMSIELDPTVDILAELGRKKGDRLLIGFAAETEDLIAEARRKLESKNCDMIVANLVSQDGIGFDSNDNEVVLITRNADPVPVRRAPKKQIATRILDEVMTLRLALHAR
jgi:phosphopantothenoylcysteine decarboxylase / phosphopantothenate---cysteine ligase